MNNKDALGDLYQTEVIQGKGGFWIRGVAFISLRQARKLTGIQAPPRPERKRILPWGDYATIAMLNKRSKS